MLTEAKRRTGTGLPLAAVSAPCALLFVAFLGLPLAALVWRALDSGQLFDNLTSDFVFDAMRLSAAFEQTFVFRGTHPLPLMVPSPLEAWRTPYAAMAREDQLPWPTLGEVTTAVQSFLDPVLPGALDATWAPAGWRWPRT